MRRQKPTTSSHVVLVDPSGRVIAADNATALTALGPGGEPTVIGVDAYPAQAVRVFNRMERAEDGLVRYDAGGASYLGRSEEHTSELQSLMRIAYAVFCLKKKK